MNAPVHLDWKPHGSSQIARHLDERWRIDADLVGRLYWLSARGSLGTVSLGAMPDPEPLKAIARANAGRADDLRRIEDARLAALCRFNEREEAAQPRLSAAEVAHDEVQRSVRVSGGRSSGVARIEGVDCTDFVSLDLLARGLTVGAEGLEVVTVSVEVLVASGARIKGGWRVWATLRWRRR